MRTDNKNKVTDRLPFWAWVLKNYVRLMFNKLYYRRFVVVGCDNLPSKGKAMLIASNHQNCMMDPLGILFSLDRHAKFLTRASVFNNPTIAKFLRTIGLVPAYRMSYDGIDSVKNNEVTFNTTEQEMLNGYPIVIFPEGMHQHSRWLGEFSFGYTKMAFEAAQKSGWEQEVFIVPSANHYKHWGHMQSDLLVSFAEPVSLKDYYELYQTKPRTAQREVNKIVRERISAMMLNIEDQDNYEAVEFLSRNYGIDYALEHGKNAEDIKDMLWASQTVVKELSRLKEEKPEVMSDICEKTMTLKNFMESVGVRDWLFRENPGWGNILMSTIGVVLLLPLFLVSLVPNILIYLAPNLIIPKVKDWMFRSTLYFGVSLVIVPLIYLITYIILGLILGNWVISLIYIMLLPFMGLFAWYYRREVIKLVGKFKYQKCANPKKNTDIASQREVLWALLEKEIN